MRQEGACDRDQPISGVTEHLKDIRAEGGIKIPSSFTEMGLATIRTARTVVRVWWSASQGQAITSRGSFVRTPPGGRCDTQGKHWSYDIIRRHSRRVSQNARVGDFIKPYAFSLTRRKRWKWVRRPDRDPSDVRPHLFDGQA